MMIANFGFLNPTLLPAHIIQRDGKLVTFKNQKLIKRIKVKNALYQISFKLRHKQDFQPICKNRKISFASIGVEIPQHPQKNKKLLLNPI